MLKKKNTGHVAKALACTKVALQMILVYWSSESHVFVVGGNFMKTCIVGNVVIA